MARSIRKREGENLDNATIARVVALLEQESPITKKAACEILNISYNTKRLDGIISEFRDRLEWKKNRKAELKGKPLSTEEEKEIVTKFLSGESFSEIEDTTCRGRPVINRVLRKYNVPTRQRGGDPYRNPSMIPDSAIREDYKFGDLVFAVRYNTTAKIIKEFQNHPEHGKVYRIRTYGANSCFAYQPYYELADLRRAQNELKIEVEEMSELEIKIAINEALLKARRGKKDE